jgi:predicted ABC-class ATPase
MSAAEAVPFQSPESLAVDVLLPRRGLVTGMGIRQGVTLIVGGGFHGKTTLLKALEAGVYNKVGGLAHFTVYCLRNTFQLHIING